MLFALSPLFVLFLAALYHILFLAAAFMVWINEKKVAMVLWLCVVCLFPFLGPVLYLLYDLSKKRHYFKSFQ